MNDGIIRSCCDEAATSLVKTALGTEWDWSLMTAHGSEDIAIQALQKGAASYVPKNSLAKNLAETLDRFRGPDAPPRDAGRTLAVATPPTRPQPYWCRGRVGPYELSAGGASLTAGTGARAKSR